MKNNTILFCNILLFSVLLFITNNQVYGQNNLRLSAGIGLPELINCGLQFRLNLVQIGASAGTFPMQGSKIISISGDIYYYFGSYSETSKKHLFFSRIGINYFQEVQKDSYLKDYYLNLRAGRDFKITNKLGIKGDFGVFIRLVHEFVGSLDFSQSAFFSTGVSIFYDLW